MDTQQKGHPKSQWIRYKMDTSMSTNYYAAKWTLQLLRNKMDTPMATQQKGHLNSQATKWTPNVYITNGIPMATQ